jgi:alpha-1,6-mannosyltransferase
VVSYYLIGKISKQLNLNNNAALIYFLNPLVIIEGVGNCHFEPVMFCLLLASIYLLTTKEYFYACIAMALSVNIKLLPLMFLPVLFWQLPFKKWVLFCSGAIAINILLFLPFLSNLVIANYIQTTNLWFVNFEFNASVYYIIRAIGYWSMGYNIIHTVGLYMPYVILTFILLLSLYKRAPNWSLTISLMAVSLFAYLMLSTTVHPWYLITLIGLCSVVNLQFAKYWSWAVILSYTAYTGLIFKEHIELIFLEYLVVLFFVVMDYLKFKKLLKFSY